MFILKDILLAIMFYSSRLINMLVLFGMMFATLVFSPTSMAAPTVIECKISYPEQELSAIKLAGTNVARESKGELTIIAGSKTLLFKNRSSFLGYGEDITYLYCARQDGYHLILKHDNSKGATGILINEKSGEIMPGGIKVLLSTDHSAYVAIEEANCSDAYEWKAYSIKNGLVANGLTFLEKEGSNAGFSIDLPTWNEQGELMTHAHCIYAHNNESSLVTLKKVGNKWAWSPRPTCKNVY